MRIIFIKDIKGQFVNASITINYSMYALFSKNMFVRMFWLVKMDLRIHVSMPSRLIKELVLISE